ncbi:hypothetical protein PENTCL1PPCAC_17621, partial [Pristionchus entomophagus]
SLSLLSLSMSSLPLVESTSIGSFLRSSLCNAITGCPKESLRRKNGDTKRRGAKRESDDCSVQVKKNEKGEAFFQCRSKLCGKWLREGEEFALHSLTHHRRKSGDKENGIVDIKGKSCNEIINHIHTDVQHLSTVLTSRQESVQPISYQSNSFYHSTDFSRSSSPLIALGTKGQESAEPIGTKIDSVSEPSNPFQTNVVPPIEEKRVPSIYKESGKRRFNWDLFVKGCIYEKVKEGVHRDEEHIEEVKKRKCI